MSSIHGQDFTWPSQTLPDDIAHLPYQQSVQPSHEFFDASIEKLVSLMQGRPSFRFARRTQLAGVAILSGLILAFGGWRILWQNQKITSQNSFLGRDLCSIEDEWQKGISLLAMAPGALGFEVSPQICPPLILNMEKVEVDILNYLNFRACCLKELICRL